MNILEALSALDTANDDDWTKDGLPKTEAVSEVVGEAVTRAQITEVAPLFTRENSVLEVPPVEPETPADPGTDPDAASDDDQDEDGTDENGEQENIADESDVGNPDVMEQITAHAAEFESGIDQFLEEMTSRIINTFNADSKGRNHPEVLTAEAVLGIAAKMKKAVTVAHSKASKTYEELVQEHAPLTHTPVENQIGIMDHISAGLARKEAKFKEAKATNAALMSVANPIDTANAKKPDNGRGNAHTQRLHGQAGNQ